MMNKLLNILFKTVVPVTIGTTVFVGCIWLIDKHTMETDVEDCEVYNLSNTFYFVSILVIIAFTTIYQLTIGKVVNRNISNKGISGYLLKILAFALSTAVVSFMISLVLNGTAEELVAVHFFLMGGILGIINTLSCLVYRKFLMKEKL